MPQIQIPFSVICQECKSEFTAIGNTPLLKCKCGHIISVKVIVQGNPSNLQDSIARKLAPNPYERFIRNKPPKSD